MPTESRKRRGPLLLMAMAFATLIGASTPHNPLVIRTASTQGSVPTDCEKGLSEEPPAPRIEIERVPLPSVALPSVALPSVVATNVPPATLRTEVEAVHRALSANDRPSFDAHLANVRALLTTDPSGAELAKVYGDVARLWDAQFTTPFFDESSAEYGIMQAYPGYAEAVRRGMLTDDRGHRFYPAGESRAFLGRVAAEQLKRIGIAVTQRVDRPHVIRVDAPPPATSPKTYEGTPKKKVTTTTPAKPKRVARKSPSHAKKPAPKVPAPAPVASTEVKPEPVKPAPVKPAPVKPAPVKPTPVKTTLVKPVPVVPKPAPIATATTETAAVPAPTPFVPTPIVSAPTATETSATIGTTTIDLTTIGTSTDTTDITDITDTAFSTTTAASATETTASAAEPAAPVPAPANPRRSMVLPVILILVGVGVLLLLFRASS